MRDEVRKWESAAIPAGSNSICGATPDLDPGLLSVTPVGVEIRSLHE
jgi:hypothetical protein